MREHIPFFNPPPSAFASWDELGRQEQSERRRAWRNASFEVDDKRSQLITLMLRAVQHVFEHGCEDGFAQREELDQLETEGRAHWNALPEHVKELGRRRLAPDYHGLDTFLTPEEVRDFFYWPHPRLLPGWDTQSEDERQAKKAAWELTECKLRDKRERLLSLSEFIDNDDDEAAELARLEAEGRAHWNALPQWLKDHRAEVAKHIKVRDT